MLRIINFSKLFMSFVYINFEKGLMIDLLLIKNVQLHWV